MKILVIVVVVIKAILMKNCLYGLFLKSEVSCIRH